MSLPPLTPPETAVPHGHDEGGDGYGDGPGFRDDDTYSYPGAHGDGDGDGDTRDGRSKVSFRLSSPYLGPT